jgi:hypothetical protein
VATFQLLSSSVPYYTVRVSFGILEFEQLLISLKEGEELSTQFQQYADTYETEWLALDVAVPLDQQITS